MDNSLNNIVLLIGVCVCFFFFKLAFLILSDIKLSEANFYLTGKPFIPFVYELLFLSARVRCTA
jgi:hypothetical protein